jgi:hypothetical protein
MDKGATAIAKPKSKRTPPSPGEEGRDEGEQLLATMAPYFRPRYFAPKPRASEASLIPSLQNTFFFA